jgi:acyl dehydratase
MISYEKLRDWKAPVARQSYDERYAAFYALAHGLGSDPRDPRELDFVARPPRRVFPTMPLALANEDRSLEHGDTGIDYGQVVLGEQSVILHRKIPVAASVVSHGKVGAIVDKGAGRNAIVTLTRTLFEEADPDRPIATMSASYIARGQGGFGGPPGQVEDASPVPDRASDHAVQLPVLPQLALLYDLTGDYVTFHVDPEAAQAIGFDGPILHGLCSVGLVARAVMACLPDGKAEITSVWVRLGAAVYPGEPLDFEIWRTDNEYRLRATAAERQVVVIRDARVSLGSL